MQHTLSGGGDYVMHELRQHIDMHGHKEVCVCAHVCTHACMHACMHIYMVYYTYIYIYVIYMHACTHAI